jgi:tripartite-type tricarboxylate transporter receptor subunit TctC
MNRWKLIATALAACAPFASLPASAEVSLAGKNVNVIVAGGVGGGVDLYMRLLLPYLRQNLPGQPNMVVQNMPGGGGIQGVQHLYNLGATDGTSIGVTPAGPIKEPVMGSGRVKYDLRRFRWVGSMTSEDTVCLVWHTSSIKSIDDARKRDVPISATGAASNSTLGPLLYNDLLGTRFKPISGYDGGTSMLAVEREEVEGRCTTLSSVRAAQPHWLSKNLVRILFTVSDMAETPETKGVPSLRSQLKSDIDIAALNFFGAPDEMQNPVFLPPNTPDDIVKAYRTAFNTAMADPKYRAEAAARAQRLEPNTGERVTEIVEAMHKTDPAVVERVKRATTVARQKK